MLSIVCKLYTVPAFFGKDRINFHAMSSLYKKINLACMPRSGWVAILLLTAYIHTFLWSETQTSLPKVETQLNSYIHTTGSITLSVAICRMHTKITGMGTNNGQFLDWAKWLLVRDGESHYMRIAQLCSFLFPTLCDQGGCRGRRWITQTFNKNYSVGVENEVKMYASNVVLHSKGGVKCMTLQEYIATKWSNSQITINTQFDI